LVAQFGHGCFQSFLLVKHSKLMAKAFAKRSIPTQSIDQVLLQPFVFGLGEGVALLPRIP
jgi:hypothetical protein